MGDSNRVSIYEAYVHKYGIGSDEPVSRRLSQEVWTPRRSCFRDWLISAFVVRWSRERYEVALFLAEDLWLLERGSGVKSGLMFILSDAYHRTGRMEITFLGPKPGQTPSFETGHEPRIPSSIRSLAAQLRVDLPETSAVLSDEAGRQLYARITGFSTATILALSRAGGPDLTRACFIVQRGVWSAEQVKYICTNALYPRRLLEGGIAPERRLSFVSDLEVMRVAITFERVLNALKRLSGHDEPPVSSRWASGCIAQFSATEDLSIRLSDGVIFPLEIGQQLRVLIVPRSSAEYAWLASKDAEVASRYGCNAVAVTTDYLSCPVDAFRTAGMRVLAPVDSLLELDREAFRRLARSVTTARKLTERPE